ARARAVLLRGRGEGVPGGGERGLRPPLRRRERHVHCGDPRRLRRRLAARADEQLRGADRRRAPPARGDDLDGQRDRRRRARRERAARRAGGADRASGQRADHRRGGRAPAGHDQLRDHVRADAAREARLSPRRGARERRRRGDGRLERRGVTAALQAAREALGGDSAWLVGGAVRDELLGRPTADYDIVVAGDPERAARAVARSAGRAACFPLSAEFGSWRVVARDGSWQVDVEPLRAETLEGDLALRDFTVNAIARPLGGGEPVDPLGGAADLRAGLLRVAGPSSYEHDPLRVLRLVRVAVELGLRPDAEALAGARAAAAGLAGVSGERIFAELRRTLATPRARAGIELAAEVGALEVALPEIAALRGVEQSAYHHADVYEHTLEVLDRCVELTAPGGPACAEADPALSAERDEVTALLAEPLADESTRGEALRWGALL